jgi:nitrate reductase alpha subunit
MSITFNGSGQSVLQVVSATYNTSTSTTSTSYITTGLTASITPQSTNSKILIMAAVPMYVAGGVASGLLTVYRGATNLALTSGATQLAFAQNYNSSTANASNTNLFFLDSPATTSSTTYTIYFSSPQATSVTAFNNNNTGSIVLQEISGS